jgi:hypothetical protein
LLEALFCILVAFSAAIISWRFIERPFRRRREALATASQQPRWFVIPSLGRAGQFALALIALLIACGSFFQESKGVLWRFPPEVRVLLAKLSRAECPARKSSPKKPTECQFGDEPADLVLWGDSHAQHYLPLIANVFGRGTAYLTPGCVPVKDAQLITKSGKPVSEDCLKNNRHAMERILATKPKIVVMASRWASIEDAYLADDKAETTREASRRTFAHAINETVLTLTHAGIKVVLMGQVPEMLSPPARCVAPFKSPHWGNCGVVPRAEANQRQHYVNETLKSLAEDKRVFFFNPFSGFCDNDYCYAIKDRELLYSDGDHLNREGPLMLVDAFRSALPEAFRLPGEGQSTDLSQASAKRG